MARHKFDYWIITVLYSSSPVKQHFRHMRAYTPGSILKQVCQPNESHFKWIFCSVMDWWPFQGVNLLRINSSLLLPCTQMINEMKNDKWKMINETESIASCCFSSLSLPIVCEILSLNSFRIHHCVRLHNSGLADMHQWQILKVYV